MSFAWVAWMDFDLGTSTFLLRMQNLVPSISRSVGLLRDIDTASPN